MTDTPNHTVHQAQRCIACGSREDVHDWQEPEGGPPLLLCMKCATDAMREARHG